MKLPDVFADLVDCRFEQGVIVFNVETIYNVYQAVTSQNPVTEKYVSVVAEVGHPVTVKVPLGCTLDEVVAQAGEITTKIRSIL